MLNLPIPSWIHKALPKKRYQVQACQGDGKKIQLQLQITWKDTPISLSILVNQQHDISYETPPLMPQSYQKAILVDLQRRLRNLEQWNAFFTHALIKNRIASDKSWWLLDLIARGEFSEALAYDFVIEHPHNNTPGHLLLLGALLCHLQQRPLLLDRFHFYLMSKSQIDERIFIAFALCKKDMLLIRSLRKTPPAQNTIEAIWDWLLQTNTEQTIAEKEWPILSHSLCLQIAARSVLFWWTESKNPKQTFYGFPSRNYQNTPKLNLPEFPEQQHHLQHFMEHGYTVLRGIISKNDIQNWKQKIADHLKEAAKQDPNIARLGKNIDALDPNAKKSSFEGSIDWGTKQLLPLLLLSPILTSTIATLVGGIERIHPALSDCMIFSQTHTKYRIFSHPHQLAKKNKLYWHLDETPKNGTIKNQKLALLAIFLLTDVDVADGPTIFLPESPKHIFQALSQASSGQDQGDQQWTIGLGKKCTKKIIATGKAGDVFLLHPLTLHTRVKPSHQSLRVISNGNIFSRNPINYVHPTSPVERYASQAKNK